MSFVAVERRILFKSQVWRGFSLRAKIFYLYLKGKYNPSGNGSIQLHYSEMADLPGFASRASFYSAKNEVLKSGWVEQTNAGGLFRNPNTYRLTGKEDGFL